jgi:nucleotide-binding universal stress UspA family protein
MRRSICVGIDDSSEAIEAARVAASLARELGRRLVLIHVADDRPVAPYGDQARRERQRRQAAERAGELLKRVATEIGEPAAGARIAFSQFVLGGVQERLAGLSQEEQADLLVIGARRRHRLAHVLFRGSLWSRFTSLAALSPCPLLVVPSGAGAGERPALEGPILCGIDESAGSQRARRVAADLSEALGQRLLPVSVRRAPRTPDSEGALHVTGHDPARALADVALRERASLVVVGMRTREMRIDSVPRELAVIAPVPVLIVPSGARLTAFAPERIAAVPDGRPLAA